MFSFHYLNDKPIIDVISFPQLNGNVNGPSLIETPAWCTATTDRYLLYFAHHEGTSIRLASSNQLTGPWKIHQPDPLDLANSCFATEPPSDKDLNAEARAFIESGSDGYYPHIASPDIWVDHENHSIRLYYHGRMKNGLQRTRVAISADGINFEAYQEILGASYFRTFKHHDWYYAIAIPGLLYRSRDGISNFEPGPRLTAETIRHHALLDYENQWYLFWTRVGDAPERVLVSRLDTSDSWSNWKIGPATEVHRPQSHWEGSDVDIAPSKYGGSMRRENQLRDPAIFQQSGKIYLLYSVAGEQGIGIGELKKI